MLVGPSCTSLRSLAPSYYEDAVSTHSIVGFCIEMEMSEAAYGEDTEGLPLFRNPNYGSGNQLRGFCVTEKEVSGPDALDDEERVQRDLEACRKRKASQRMSTTFESVMGFGRNMKRRVSSLWPKEGNDRKDSRWVNLDNGENDQAAKSRKASAKAGENGRSRWGSKRASASKQNNPYPHATWLLSRRAQQQASRPTSAHWTPCTNDANSTTGLFDVALSRQVTGRSVSASAAVGHNPAPRMESLTRQPGPAPAPAPEDSALPTPGEIVNDDTIPQQEISDGRSTPSKDKPQARSLMESGYRLDQHLSNAMKLGRFDFDRIARRFASEESESSNHESPFDAESFFRESPPAADNEDDAVTEGGYYSAEERLTESKEHKPRTWFSSWKEQHMSQPREPRPSVAVGDQEQGRATFGETFAQLAGVVGTSMQQANVML